MLLHTDHSRLGVLAFVKAFNYSMYCLCLMQKDKEKLLEATQELEELIPANDFDRMIKAST